MKNGIVVPLNIPGINVVGQSMDENGNLIIHAENAQKGCECPSCNKTIYNSHGYRKERAFRHTSVFGTKSYINIRLKRFECFYCDESPTAIQPLTRPSRNQNLKQTTPSLTILEGIPHP